MYIKQTRTHSLAQIYLDQKQKAVDPHFSHFSHLFLLNLTPFIFNQNTSAPLASYSSNGIIVYISLFSIFSFFILSTPFGAFNRDSFFFIWIPFSHRANISIYLLVQEIHLCQLLTKQKEMRWMTKKWQNNNIIMAENPFDKYWPNWIASICTMLLCVCVSVCLHASFCRVDFQFEKIMYRIYLSTKQIESRSINRQQCSFCVSPKTSLWIHTKGRGAISRYSIMDDHGQFREKSMLTTEQKHENVTNNRFPFSNVFTLLNRDWQ